MPPMELGPFLEPLRGKNVYELAQWINKTCKIAFVNNQIDSERLQWLYDAWTMVESADETEIKAHFPKDADVLIANQAIMRSKKYRRAVLALARPFPQFWVKPGMRDGPVNVSRIVYDNYTMSRSMINATLEEFTASYEDKIDECLKRSKGEHYRKDIKKLIYTRQICHNIVYCVPDIHNKQRLANQPPAKIIAALPRLKMDEAKIRDTTKITNKKKAREIEKINEYIRSEKWNREHFEDYDCWQSGEDVRLYKKGTDQELKRYAISVQVMENYLDGIVKKPFMVRLAFYLGLDGKRANQLLMREGYTLDGSVRLWDGIVWNCFKLGIPFTYADRLLARNGLETIGPKRKGT